MRCAPSVCVPARSRGLVLVPLVLWAAAGCGGGSGGDAASPAASSSTTAAGSPSGSSGGAAPAVTPTAPAVTPTAPAVTPPAAAATYTVRVLDADGQAGPFALNAAGQVAFTAVRPDGTHALFFNGTSVQTLAGAGSRAVAVNASGQVAGDAGGGGGPRAFLWTSPGPPQDLSSPAVTTSAAVAINASGQVTGTFAVGNQRSKAFSWTPGGQMVQLENLGGVTNVTATSQPVQINDAGSIAGNASNPAGATHAVQWGPAVRIRDLPGTFAGDSTAKAMNTAGDIVGEAENLAAGSRVAFLSRATAGLMQSLGTLGGKNSSAVAINDAGQVAGESQNAQGVPHAFLWEPAGGGSMRDLGTLGGLGSTAVALGDNGQVCGTSDTTGGPTHAFLWSVAGGMVDLNARLAGAPAGLVVLQCVAMAGGRVLAQSTAGLVLLQPR